jgi:hypothetical protein
MRRFLIAALASGLVGAFLFPTAAIAKAGKTAICHFNADDDPDTPEFELLMVKSGKAVAKHLAHGDGVPGGDVLDENCQIIFAIAYTDVDPNDGPGFKDGTDVLISKLVDGNDNGVTDVGDKVIPGRYPKDFTATTFGTFQAPQHTIDSSVFSSGSSTITAFTTSGFSFQWFTIAGSDQYSEAGNGPSSRITDAFASAGSDGLVISAAMPSQPERATGTTRINRSAPRRYGNPRNVPPVSIRHLCAT